MGKPYYDKYEPLVIEIEPPMCEQVSVRFETSGECGGDAGHGGYATITFSMKQGGCGIGVNVEARDLKISPAVIPKEEQRWRSERVEAYADDAEEVSLTVVGDWELSCLAESFIKLGEELKSKGMKLSWLADDFQEKCDALG